MLSIKGCNLKYKENKILFLSVAKIYYIFVLHFAQVDSIVAIPASIKSVETVIVKIVDQSTNESERKIFDDWGQMIKGWQSFLGTHYLCKSS